MVGSGIVDGSGFVGSALDRHVSKCFNLTILDVRPIPKLECPRTNEGSSKRRGEEVTKLPA